MGAGFGGLGMGISSTGSAIADFTIFERADDRRRRRGAPTPIRAPRCDVQSHLYSFSFAPGHDWSRRYAAAGGDPHLPRRLARTIRPSPAPAVWPAVESAELRREHRGAGRSRLTPARSTRSASSVVTACGQLEDPALPDDRRRRDDFAGPALHSAEWDHDVDLDGTARRGPRHRGERDPVRAGGGQGRRPRRRSTSAPPRGSCPRPTAPTPSASRCCSTGSLPAWSPRGWALRAFYELGTYGFTGTDWSCRGTAGSAERLPRRQLDSQIPIRSSSPRRRPTTRWAASG